MYTLVMQNTQDILTWIY